MVQRRAARYTLHRYRRTSSVGAMLEELKWKTLSERRRISSLTMFYKIHNNLVAIEMPPTLTLKHPGKATRSQNSHAYYIPGSSREYHRMAFFQRTARDWNSLPEATVNASSPESFRRAVLAG